MAQRTIAQKADMVATFRYMSVFLMETLARWTPLTPQLEVKVLFGRHLWEFAQHADILGQRTSELRAGMHYTRPPVAPYREALGQYAAIDGATDRVHGVYDVLIPDLIRRYETFLQDADVLLDQPTIRIVERILHDLTRLQAERHDMLADATLAPPGPASWADSLKGRLAAHPEFVDFRPLKEATA